MVSPSLLAINPIQAFLLLSVVLNLLILIHTWEIRETSFPSVTCTTTCQYPRNPTCFALSEKVPNVLSHCHCLYDTNLKKKKEKEKNKEKKKNLKSQCHTKRRTGVATHGHSSFGMTTNSGHQGPFCMTNPTCFLLSPWLAAR